MSSAVVVLPKISTGARIACTAGVAALALLAGTVAPAQAEGATTTAVGQGTYENDDPAVTLSGTWSKVSSNQDSGGSTGSLSSAGYAELSFKTSGIRWITRKNSYSGIVDVYLDGVKKTTVDLYSSTTKTQQVAYEVTGLSETTHTIRVVRTGTKNASSSSANMQLDAFVAPDVHKPAAPTGLKAVVSGANVNLSWTANTETDVKGYRIYRREGSSTTRTQVGSTTVDSRTLTDASRSPGVTYTYDLVAVDTSDLVSAYSTATSVTMPISAKGAGTYENDDAAVLLNGSWSLVSSGMDSGGSYATLNGAGYAEISFKTSGIRWISRLNSYSGLADVYLDGVKKATVDLYSSTTRYQQVAYEAKGLTETNHTLRVVRTGTKNASSSSTAIMLDAFVAPDVYPPAAPAGLVAAPKTGSVQLGWTASPESDVIGYRVYRGAATGALTAITTDPVTDAGYTDDGLLPGATYRYQVTALDDGGNESPVSATVTTTVTMKAVPAGTYEDDSDSLTMKGSWSRTTSTGANTDSGGSFASLGDTGYAEMSFATSGIRWLARTNSSSGLADVYIDGVKRSTVDLYSSTTRFAQTVYEVGGLSETGHTIRIVRTGSKNADSQGRNITLDALVAPDVYAPATPTALKATGTRTGAKLTWTKSPDGDVDTYRVFRRASGSSTDVLVGSVSADTTSFADVGLADGASYTWTVVARDDSGNDSTPSLAAAFTNAGDPYAAFPQRAATCPTATVAVSTRSQLLSAIAAAGPGTVIRLSPGNYGANVDVYTAKGTPDKPIWICGPRTAIIDNADVTKGYGFRINGATNLVVAGMTVRNVQKGVAVLNSKAVTIADLRVEAIGDEAIHLKNQTTDSTVIGNSIASTGLNAPNYGEGVYIGTAQGNWCLYNSCDPDASDRNLVAFNDIRSTTAEPMEAKAGTNDGTMWKNTLDGAAITSSDTDSLVQVMGNGWVIAGNTGAHTPADAIQVWNTDTDYGLNNIVYGNAVTDALPGYGVRMPYNDGGNVVGCDNTASRAALGMSNKTCQN